MIDSPTTARQPGPVRRLLVWLKLAKARQVKEPGKRGGHYWVDQARRVRYGNRPERKGTIQFVSPNVDDNLSRRQAAARLRSRCQREVVEFGRRVDHALGIQSTYRSAVGDWDTGAENAYVVEAPEKSDFERATVSFQIAGVVFHPDNDREGRVYLVPRLPRASKPHLRRVLDAAGVHSRTSVVGQGDLVDLLVASPDGQHDEVMVKIGTEAGTNVEIDRGHFRIIGDPQGGSRERAVSRYARIAEDYIQTLQSEVRADEKPANPNVRRLQQVVRSLRAPLDEARAKHLEKAEQDSADIHAPSPLPRRRLSVDPCGRIRFVPAAAAAGKPAGAPLVDEFGRIRLSEAQAE